MAPPSGRVWPTALPIIRARNVVIAVPFTTGSLATVVIGHWCLDPGHRSRVRTSRRLVLFELAAAAAGAGLAPA